MMLKWSLFLLALGSVGALRAESDVAQLFYRLSFDGSPSSGVSIVNDGGIGTATAQNVTGGYLNYHGTSTTAGVPSAPRFGAYCMRSNGGLPGYITTDGLGVNGQEGFTISFWFWAAQMESWRSCFGFTFGSQNYRFEHGATDSNQFYHFPGSGWSGGVSVPSTWNHVVFTIENGVFKTYLNGELVNTNSNLTTHNTQPLGPLTQLISGGGRTEGAANEALREARLAAWIDEVAVFDRALSQDAVAWLSANPANVPFQPQVRAEASSLFSTAAWSWPGGEEGDIAALPNLIISGTGTRQLTIDTASTVTGTLSVFKTDSSAAAPITFAKDEAADAKLTVNGAVRLCVDTVLEAGAVELANVTLDPGKRLTVNDAVSLKGAVVVPAGATLDLTAANVLPLQNVTSLTVLYGGTLKLPITGYDSVAVLTAGEFVLNGAVLNAAGVVIAGTVSGGIFTPEPPFVWNQPSGSWSSTVWQSQSADTRLKDFIFRDAEGGSASVAVSGTVEPMSILFENSATTYTFTNADNGAIVLYPGESLATAEQGAPVTVAVPLTLSAGLTVADGSSLTLNPLFGAAPTATAATHAAPLAIGTGATLAIQPPSGAVQTLNTAFTGSGTLALSGGGAITISQIPAEFSGNVTVSNATLRLTASSGGNGVFSHSVFAEQIPISIRSGGVVELGVKNAVGWQTAHRPSFFAELKEGATLKKTNSEEESMTRGLCFTGSSSVVNASSIVWRLRSGITLKAVSGTTTFSQTGSGGFALFNDGASGSANATRTLFDCDEGATIDIAATVTYVGGNNGLAKNGPGTLILSGSSTHPCPVEVNAGTLSVTGSSTGNATYTIASGATLRGTGTIGGTGGVTVKNGATVEMGLSIAKLTLENGITIKALPETNPLAVSTALTAPSGATVSVDVSAMPTTQFRDICTVLSWPQNSAPAATFQLTGENTRIFGLRMEETGVVLYRKTGILISLY